MKLFYSQLAAHLALTISLSCIAVFTYGQEVTLSNVLNANPAQHGFLGTTQKLGITLNATGHNGEPLCLYSMSFVTYATYTNGVCTNRQRRTICIRSNGINGATSPCGVDYVSVNQNVGGTLLWLPQSIYDMGDGLGKTYYDSGATQCIQITNIQAQSGSSCTTGGTVLSFSGSPESTPPIPVSNCGNPNTCTFLASNITINLS